MNPTTQKDPGTPASSREETVAVEIDELPRIHVTAVQVAPAVHRSKWQHLFDERAKEQGKILETS